MGSVLVSHRLSFACWNVGSSQTKDQNGVPCLARQIVNHWTTSAKSFQPCLTLGDPVDCTLPGSSVHGILQAEYWRLDDQFSSVAQSCPTLCDPMNCSTPGLPVHHQFLEPTQSHVHWVGDAIQPSHPLPSPSPPALNLSQHQGLFQWVSSLHQVTKVLEFQLQHQSFQWTPRTDLF